MFYNDHWATVSDGVVTTIVRVRSDVFIAGIDVSTTTGSIDVYSTYSLGGLRDVSPPPKWWRWYDVFRTPSRPKSLLLLDRVVTPLRRVQERYPEGQRRRQKRRAYIQRLRAA